MITFLQLILLRMYASIFIRKMIRVFPEAKLNFNFLCTFQLWENLYVVHLVTITAKIFYIKFQHLEWLSPSHA